MARVIDLDAIERRIAVLSESGTETVYFTDCRRWILALVDELRQWRAGALKVLPEEVKSHDICIENNVFYHSRDEDA